MLLFIHRHLLCQKYDKYDLDDLRRLKADTHKAVPGFIAGAIVVTEEDKAAVRELAEIAGVDYEKYGMDMLKAGADISDYSAEKLAGNDTKEFESAGKTFSCGQISVMDLAPINAKKADIMAALEATKAAKGYAASYLMVTDILAEDTYLWFTSGAEEAAEKAFGKKAEDGAVYLPKVMSRKKQVAPFLLKAYAE